MPGRAHVLAFITHTALALVTGAGATVAVSSALALNAGDLTHQPSSAKVSPSTCDNRWGWSIDLSTGRGVTRWSAACDGPEPMFICGTGMLDAPRPPPPVVVPDWIKDRLSDRERALDAEHNATTPPTPWNEMSWLESNYVDEFAGWPMLALHSQSRTAMTYTAPSLQHVIKWTRGGVTIPRSRTDAFQQLAAVPLTPVWPGFLVNTAFYGAIAWVVLLAPRAIRRALRGRRNRCIACGYDRRGIDAATPCPECGHAPPCHGLAARGQSVS